MRLPHPVREPFAASARGTVFRPPEAEWRAPTTAPPACRGVAGSPMSGADRWPVDAAAVAEAFRMTDAAWESAVEAADVVMLYEAAAATRASAALAEEEARYEDLYTAEYGERADLEALYAAAAWAKVAALGGARRGEGDDGERGGGGGGFVRGEGCRGAGVGGPSRCGRTQQRRGRTSSRTSGPARRRFRDFRVPAF